MTRRSGGVSLSQRNAQYARDNIQAAKIILSRAGEFGGTQSGLCTWAQLVLWKTRRLRRTA